MAFMAKDRAAVDAFYHAAIAAGGKDHGAPGLRPHYHPNYYGAFVLDPDGHNVEAVCHAAGVTPRPHDFSFSFRFLCPSVRSRSAFSRINPSASRWS